MNFLRCAECHGVLRKGATGKSLLPNPNAAKKSRGTLKLGTKRLSKIIKLGTEGGMINFDDIFSDEEINLLALPMVSIDVGAALAVIGSGLELPPSADVASCLSGIIMDQIV
jgi:mono/diheme cytochrome c family protein